MMREVKPAAAQQQLLDQIVHDSIESASCHKPIQEVMAHAFASDRRFVAVIAQLRDHSWRLFWVRCARRPFQFTMVVGQSQLLQLYREHRSTVLGVKLEEKRGQATIMLRQLPNLSALAQVQVPIG